MVTDEVIRGTGLVEKVEAGVADGGLEVAGVFDDVPQDSDDRGGRRGVPSRPEAGGADSFLAVGGGSVIDTTKGANVVFSHGGASREWEGFFRLPRERDGMGRPLPLAPLGRDSHHRRHGLRGEPRGGDQGPRAGVKLLILDFPLAPAGDPRPRIDRDPAGADRGGHRNGRAHPRDRGRDLDRVEPARRRLRASGAPADPRQPGARRRRHLGRGRARATC